MKKYSGLIIPIVTPFDRGGNIDFLSLDKIIQRCIDWNADILALGTTGETASLSKRMKMSLISHITTKYKNKIKIFIGIAESSFAEAVDLANFAFQLGVDAVFLLPPFYYPLTKEQILNYYSKFSDIVPGDIFIYNIPQTTHISIPLDVVDILSGRANIVGIKDSERELERMKKAIQMWKDRQDFSYFIGWGAQCFNALYLGADGLVPSTGNFNVKIYTKMIEYISEKNIQEAQHLQNIADEISEIYQKGRSIGESISALKVMMNEINLCDIFVLPPLTVLPDEVQKDIRGRTREIIQKYNLLED